MAIVFGGDTGLRQDAKDVFFGGIKKQFNDVADGLKNAFSLTASVPPMKPKENVHVDTGFTNVPGTSFVGSSIDNVDDIQQRRITSQEPVLTVYIKKRAFRSLRNENDTKFLDDGEKLFLRATKLLFEKKCQQVGSYEALTKAKSILDEEADLDMARINAIADSLSDVVDTLKSNIDAQFAQQNKIFAQNSPQQWKSIQDHLVSKVNDLDEMKKNIGPVADGLRDLGFKAGKLRHATKTTWVVDIDQPDVFLTGRGCGVIELTLISDLNTSLGIDGAAGSISFTMQDPYNLTKITNDDIEAALSAAKTELDDVENTHKGPQVPYDLAIRKEEQLRKMRKDRIAQMLGISNSGNAVLSGSDATEIVFEVQPSGMSANRVTATVGEIPESFNSANYAIAMARLPVEQQLTPSEHKVVQEIFSLLEEYVSELQRINHNYIFDNQSADVTSARTSLRTHYLGKSIIQPMDSVNVYMRSNTTLQNELIGPLNSLLNNTSFIKSFSEDQEVTDTMLEEEMKVLGIDNLGIPVDLYQSIRTGSLLRNAGTHVFGGIITSVAETYNASDGTYTTAISGASNIQWLNQSRINVTPSLDQTQGMLEDPLTAFDINVNPATGLVEETKDAPKFNQSTQKRIEDSLILYNNGLYPGDKIDIKNMIQDYISNEDGTSIPQYKHAPGVVYKWKKGIMVATRNVNLKTPLDGKENQSAKLRRDMGFTVVSGDKNGGPFAGQDAADVISTLVTGFPHNYESFYENSLSIGTYNNSNSDNNPTSFFHSFFDINRTFNRTFGNFQPFKMIKVDPKVMNERLAQQKYLKSTSKNLSRLRNELAKLEDKYAALGDTSPLFKGFNTEDTSKDTETDAAVRATTKSELEGVRLSLQALIDALKAKILDESSKFRNTKTDAQSTGLRLYGSDLAFDFTGSSAESENEGTKETYSRIRLHQTIMQFRPQFDCKFNLDNNLFIVGDEYDKDLDIQAFVVNMSKNIDTWNSEFRQPLEICQTVAKTLNFEFFCNTQGHLEFRPPRYNKVPLSLLLKMLLLDKREGKRLYPDFLTGLFKTKQKNVDDEIAVVDLSIAIEGILLNKPSDPAALTEVIIGGNGDTIQHFGGTSTMSEVKPTDDLVTQLLKKRSELLSKTSGGKKTEESSPKDKEAAAKEIQALNDPSQPDMYVKRQAHVNKLAQLVSRRQRLMDMQTKMLAQAKGFDGLPGDMTKNMSPELLAQLGDIIEDDMNDFLGPNSSKRYIIYDDQIMNYTFTESCDNVYCRVDVNGQQDLTGDSPGDLAGVPVLWAGATDFDLWRQYGWKADAAESRPFLKDAETQCAPYAVMLLSRNRRQAVKGTITVVGNEYYQLGDVVYINSRDMLFYVTSVAHNFSYSGGNFTTTLTLEYGHSLGDYIPTPLDIIGKEMIKSQKRTNCTNTSKAISTNALGRHVASIIFPRNTNIADKKLLMLSGTYARFNLNELKNTLMIANKHVIARKASDYPKLEIRAFAFDGETKARGIERIKAVAKWLTEPCGIYIDSDKRYTNIGNTFTDKKIDKRDADFRIVKVPPIMLNEDIKKNNSYIRLPKEEVFNMVGSAEPLGDISNIIEIVLVFGDQ